MPFPNLGSHNLALPVYQLFYGIAAHMPVQSLSPFHSIADSMESPGGKASAATKWSCGSVVLHTRGCLPTQITTGSLEVEYEYNILADSVAIVVGYWDHMYVWSTLESAIQ
jgi:hypothetical protein